MAALSSTSICNMALARIGSTRINDIDTDQSVAAQQCRLHYEQTRDSLLRSHWWRFASARVILVEDPTEPSFEWDHQFILPNDFLRLKSIYEDYDTSGSDTRHSFAIEGKRLLANESAIQIRYVKRVEDVSQFDPLFVEVLVLELAVKLVMALSQDEQLRQSLSTELLEMIMRVRTIDAQETQTTGRNDLSTWYDARLVGA